MTLSLLLAAAAAGQDAGAPILAFPNTGSGGEASTYFAFNLANGSAALVDRLRRDPLSLRSRDLSENLFKVIGRSTSQAAFAGEIFFAPIDSGDGSVRAALYVETPIGYAAFFDSPGKGGRLGEVLTLTGRPYESIAAPDGNYALLMRHDHSGRTEGAYLYHATTGQAVYLNGLLKLSNQADVHATAALPALAGPVAAAELHNAETATASYLVTDAATGEIHFLDISSAAGLAARKAGPNLYDVISAEGAHSSNRRFVLVPLQESRSRTPSVLVVDAVSGAIAVIQNVLGEPVLVKSAATVDSALPGTSGERVFSAVPNVDGNGQTVGVWIIDSQSGTTLYLDKPASPAELTVSRVRVERE